MANRHKRYRSSQGTELENKAESKRRDGYGCLACAQQLTVIRKSGRLGLVCSSCSEDPDPVDVDANVEQRVQKNNGYSCSDCEFQLHSHHLAKSLDDTVDVDSMAFISEINIEDPDNGQYGQLLREADAQGLTITQYVHQKGNAPKKTYDDSDLLLTLCGECHREYHSEEQGRDGTHQEILQIMKQQ